MWEANLLLKDWIKLVVQQNIETDNPELMLAHARVLDAMTGQNLEEKVRLKFTREEKI